MVLLQRGKDASGDLFGAGASAVLSSQGTTTFLVKLTSSLGVMFFLLSVLLGYMVNHSVSRISLKDVLAPVPAEASLDGNQASTTTVRPKNVEAQNGIVVESNQVGKQSPAQSQKPSAKPKARADKK
ncbi:MAG: preprotein translocase subunit SecG [Pseudomonadota bacterium]|nr:preprotein translocase subunit SecG [Pseudomonadota bacterium]